MTRLEVISAECSPGITSTLASSGEAAERIKRADRGFQRDIGAHFPIILKIHLLLVEQSSPRRASGSARSFGGSPNTECDSSATRGSWPRWRAACAAPIAMSANSSAFGRKWISVSATKMVRPRWPSSRVSAERDAALGRADGLPHVVQADRSGAGQAGHHRVCVAGRHHAGSEHVAVLVHHALAVTLQESFALQARVEQLGVFRVGAGQPGVMDLDPVDDAQAQAGHGRLHPVLAADQHRAAIAGVAERDRGAHGFFFLALGEHHALADWRAPLP